MIYGAWRRAHAKMDQKDVGSNQAAAEVDIAQMGLPFPFVAG